MVDVVSCSSQRGWKCEVVSFNLTNTAKSGPCAEAHGDVAKDQPEDHPAQPTSTRTAMVCFSVITALL